MSNIDNRDNREIMDSRSVYDLSNYGRAMKFYAIAKLIWTVFSLISLILVFAFQSSILELATLTE